MTAHVPPHGAMVQLGTTNSRMKDYDRWFMSRHFEFGGSTLAKAVRATFERRGNAIPGRSQISLSVEFAADPNHVGRWAVFTENLGAPATLAWTFLLTQFLNSS